MFGMDAAQIWHRETLGEKTAEALKKNNFIAFFVKDKTEARNKLLSLIEDGVALASADP